MKANSWPATVDEDGSRRLRAAIDFETMGETMDIHQEMLDVVQRAMHGMLTGDLAELQAAALPHEHLAKLLQHPDAEQLARVPEEMSYLQTSICTLSGRRAMADVYLRGMLSPVPLVKTPAGWRVDLRWWIAAADPPTEAQQTVRVFMYAMIGCDRQMLAEVALPHPDIEMLLESPPPAGEMAQMADVCEHMPLLELRPGEVLDPAYGPQPSIPADQIGPDRKVMIGQFAQTEIIFQLKYIDGRWRVDPSPIIDMVMRAKRDHGAGPEQS